MKSKFALFLVLALTVLGLPQVAAQQKTTELRFVTWTGNQAQLDLLGTFAKEFAQKSGANVAVKFETIPFAEYTTKLALQLQSSSPPDAGWILENTAPTFIEGKLLYDLTKAMKPYDPADFSEPAMGLWKKGGKTFAVPFSTSPFIVIFNRDLFAKAGIPAPDELMAKGAWTTAAFRESAAKIKAATGVYGFQGIDGQAYDARIWHNLVPFIRGFGGDAWTDGGKVEINDAKSIAGVGFFRDMLLKDGSVVPPGDQSDFFNGAAAMTVGQLSRVSKLANVSWKWGLATLPAGPASDAQVLGQAAMGVFAKGKNAALAADLVAYMTSESCVARMAGIWPPARKSVLASEAFLSSNAAVPPAVMKSVIAKAIEVGKTLPAHKNFPQIDMQAKAEFDKLWKPSSDTKTVMDAVAAIVKKNLK
jgi:multiple sugar transport system substrate-binding protein